MFKVGAAVSPLTRIGAAAKTILTSKEVYEQARNNPDSNGVLRH
jgi:hypothetical protein